LPRSPPGHAIRRLEEHWVDLAQVDELTSIDFVANGTNGASSSGSTITYRPLEISTRLTMNSGGTTSPSASETF
jgi:hypothetical protein